MALRRARSRQVLNQFSSSKFQGFQIDLRADEMRTRVCGLETIALRRAPKFDKLYINFFQIEVPHGYWSVVGSICRSFQRLRVTLDEIVILVVRCGQI